MVEQALRVLLNPGKDCQATKPQSSVSYLLGAAPTTLLLLSGIALGLVIKFMWRSNYLKHPLILSTGIFGNQTFSATGEHRCKPINLYTSLA